MEIFTADFSSIVGRGKRSWLLPIPNPVGQASRLSISSVIPMKMGIYLFLCFFSLQTVFPSCNLYPSWYFISSSLITCYSSLYLRPCTLQPSLSLPHYIDTILGTFLLDTIIRTIYNLTREVHKI